MAKSNKTQAKQNKFQEDEKQNQSQVYDTSMKELVDRQVKDIVPVLLPGATYKDTLNVEIVKPVMRTDKVYIIEYREWEHILHLEFESSGNPRMDARMSAYNSILHLQYDLPVISILIYLFKTAMVVAPFVMKGGDGTITTFNFHIIPLFQLRAEQYVHEHITCMYPLLPTMDGATHQMLQSAMKELAEVYRDDNDTLSDFFAYMVILLDRVETITPLEKARMKVVLNMYNNLWDQSPIIQKMKAASEAKGKVEGQIETLQEVVVSVVQLRFPALTEVARQKVAQVDKPELLKKLHDQVILAPDETSVRLLLAPTVA